MKKWIAEAFGTAVLVLVGCGSVAIGGLGGALGSDPLGAVALLPIALAFGLSVTAMAYGIGPISGCHINPAVTIAACSAGRMSWSEAPGYIVSQVIGAIAGAAILAVIVKGRSSGYDIAANGLGQTTFSNYSTLAAFIVETVATLIFTVVILGATSKAGATPVAGLVIGLSLAVLHLAFIKATGNSLNPARSIGPALFVGGDALAQLWLYIVAPSLGGFIAGALFRSKTFED